MFMIAIVETQLHGEKIAYRKDLESRIWASQLWWRENG